MDDFEDFREVILSYPAEKLQAYVDSLDEASKTLLAFRDPTLVIIKPKTVAKDLTDTIIKRIEEKGLRVRLRKNITATLEQAQSHYADHKGKPWFEKITKGLCEGPIVVLVVGGDNAVACMRELQGATNPQDAKPGTLRHDYGTNLEDNVTHASDSIESARREIKVWYGQK